MNTEIAQNVPENVGLGTVTIQQGRFDDLLESSEFIEYLDCILTKLHTERGSFAAALAEIGDSMDWLVQAYAIDGKPWLSPLHLLNSATDSYEGCGHD